MDRREFLGGAASGLLLPKDMANIDWLAFAQKNEQDTPAPETVRLRPVSDAQVQQIIKDVEELKRWRGMHSGLDWAQAGIDYPHPNFRFTQAWFANGYGRLSDAGLRLPLGSNGLTDAATLFWISNLDSPATVPVAYIYASRSTNDVYIYQFVDSTSGPSSAIAELGDSPSLTGGGYYDVTLIDTSGNPIAYSLRTTFFGIGAPAIRLSSQTSDPSGGTASDGGIWYRSDTDKFRGRANGATVSFATEGGPDVIPYASKSAGYTTTANDGFIAVDASGAARTITLITAVGNTGLRYTIKKTDSSANTVVIDGNGSQTIDGAVTVALSRQYEAITIVSDGANWLIESRY